MPTYCDEVAVLWGGRKRDMDCLRLCSSSPPNLSFQKTVKDLNGHNFPSNIKRPTLFSPPLSTPKYTGNCTERTGVDAPLSSTSAYAVLGVEPGCSAGELKAAFRTKVRIFEVDFALLFFWCFSLVKYLFGSGENLGK